MFDRWFLTFTVPLLFVLPTLAYTRFGSLRFLSWAGNIALLLSVLAVIVDAIEQRETFRVGPDLAWWTGSLTGAFEVFQLSSTAPLALLLPDVLRVIEESTPGRAMKLVWLAFGLLSGILIVVGFLNHLTYFRWMDSTGLLAYNFMDPRSGTTLMLEISVLLNTLLTDAVLIWWLAKQLTVFIVPENKTWLADFLSGVTMFLFRIMTSFTPDEGLSVLHLLSLVPRTLMLYVLPSVIFLRFFHFKPLIWSITAVVALLIGAGITAAATYWGVVQCIRAFA
jgi:hypothetical protein